MWFQVTGPADPEHVAAVVAALGRARVRDGSAVVAVDGPSGSGKTTLANAVADALGCPVVHLDELYPGWDGLAAVVPLLVDQVLLPLSRGEDARYRVWDWAHDRWGGERTVAAAPVVVVEGCGASVGAAGGLAAVRVWVEASTDERRRRGLARDGETYRPHWERWAAQERDLFGADGTRERADLVLVTDGAR
ncbi:AAA family ATPase [Phycicoccus duodecadis]|uniref:Uridine kinase n=1 Tax=Phycicoccus duodecadis TaxID=173053 RepID=A0A2N3YNH2_9MICO|nr:AAA family ATPase [Phycicoccus duodecadis]PKW28373.1 uridine kinase [Phycicoccus duodecadis]